MTASIGLMGLHPLAVGFAPLSLGSILINCRF